MGNPNPLPEAQVVGGRAQPSPMKVEKSRLGLPDPGSWTVDTGLWATGCSHLGLGIWSESCKDAGR